MPFYAFRLNKVDCQFQRGKIPDDDVILLQVTLNGVVRGLASVRIPNVTSGQVLALAPPRDRTTPFTPIPPTTMTNARTDWVIGPFEIAPTDNVAIGYSGTNLSDWELGPDTSAVDKVTLDLAKRFAVAMAGLAVGGLVGVAAAEGVDAVTDLLGKVSDDPAGDVKDALDDVEDPIGKLIGAKAQGPCNGTVFTGVQAYTGAALAALPFQPPGAYAAPPDAEEHEISIGPMDDGPHDTDICGHAASTTIHWSVLRIPDYRLGRDSSRPLSGGLRRYATPGQDLHLRSFAHLRF